MEFDYNGNKVVSKFEKGDLVCRYWGNGNSYFIIARISTVRFSMVENKINLEYQIKPESYVYLRARNFSLDVDASDFDYFEQQGKYWKEQDLLSVEDGIYSLVEELEKKKEFLSKLSESLSQQEMGRK